MYGCQGGEGGWDELGHCIWYIYSNLCTNGTDVRVGP